MASDRLALRTRGFVAYLVTQFLGAFNDNAFKFTLIFFLQATAVSEAQEGRWWGLAQALFAIPFVAFAMWSGLVADRWGKASLMRVTKAGEVLIMLLGVAAFLAQSVPALLIVMFLMSTQSTVFGPCKYGYLAEKVREEDLSRANGVVQTTTMIAAVSGQVTGGLIAAGDPGDPGFATLTLVALAALGFTASLFVPRAPPARPHERLRVNVLPELRAVIAQARANPPLLYAVGGIGHFFLLAALLQLQLTDYARTELSLGEDGAAVLVSLATVGIAAGSLLAARWSHGHVEAGLVPLGALGMSLGLLLLSAVEPFPLPVPEGMLGFWADGLWWPFLVTFGIGVTGGLFIVPVWSLLQLHAPVDGKGRTTAFANMVSFLGIFASAFLVWLPRELGLSLRAQLALVALLSLAGTLVALRQLPYAFVRFVGWLLTHSVYRIRVHHGERLPKRGGALILANHVSWVDALVLQAVTQRRLHFLIYRPYYEWWPLRWLFRLAGCIPVSGDDGREQLDASLAAAGDAVQRGRLVVIFPEGAVTRLGHMLPLRTGYQRIVAGRDLPLLPVHLGELWGSLFSHAGGRLLWKVPRAFPYPVQVTVGEPLPGDSPPPVVRAALRELSAESWEARRADRLPLHLTLLRERRRDLRRRYTQHGRAPLSCAGLLARARLLAKRLDRELGPGRRVALALQAPLDQLLAQLALLLAGRVPVVLDPRLPLDELRRALHRAECTGLLADASVFADQRGPALVGELPAFDFASLTSGVSRARRVARGLLDALTPWPLLKLALGRRACPPLDDAACVLLASPGTDHERPVPLSHAQLLMQVEAVQQVLGADDRDGVLGVLPTWRVYGQLATVWFPVLAGLRAGWHDDPADRRSLARFLRRAELNALPANPALLETLLEHARPDTLGGLRFVLCGEHPLDERLRERFAERFGLTPLACWTASEVGGLITLNTPDVRTHGVYQRGTRHGTVGHPLPGTSVVAVNDAGESLPYGMVGRLRVVAPGLADRLRAFGGRWAGWQLAADGRSVLTDDIGSVDDDGFVRLHTRGVRGL